LFSLSNQLERSSATEVMNLALPDALDQARRHHQAGNWRQAEQVCQQILHLDPGQLDALHLLGLIAAQTGRYDLAADWFKATVRLKPDFAGAHNNLGNVYVLQAKLPEAVESFRAAARYAPDFASAHSNLGNALRELGHFEEAVASLRQAVRLRPDFAEAHLNLAIALQSLGNFGEALASYRQALLYRPNYIEAHFNLGNALIRQGNPAEAAAHLEQAVRLKADHADAHQSLAVALKTQGKLDEAILHYEQVLRIKPADANAYLDLGNALQEQGKLPQAMASYRQAALLRPDLPAAHNNLGNALQELGQFTEAEAALRQALGLMPDFVVASFNLGIVFWKQGRLDAAETQYRHTLRLKPDHFDARLNLAVVLRKLGKLDAALAECQEALTIRPDHADAHRSLGNVLADQGRLLEAVTSYRTALHFKPQAADIHSSLVLTLHYLPGHDSRSIRDECERWNRQHAEPLKKLQKPHANSREPERRLRIGYVSPDFRDHVDSFFTLPLFSNHNHQKYQIFCYANVQQPDAVTERLHGYADVWRSTVGLSDQEVADLVRADQIDILVDLEMHSANNRLLMFAQKPAPVQAAWLAYPGTTGLTAIDYRLTDPYLDPPGQFDDLYSEESIRLPETFWCYDPLSNEPPVNALPALESGHITFGCLNNYCKVNQECLALWASVLREVQPSRLLLRAPRGNARSHVTAAFRQEGIDETRIEFVDTLPRREYLRLYHRIDLGLDPIPCTGHTTSLDAFWMGLPTVTLVGETVVGRAGWSQVCNLGLLELAAQTPAQYVALAARWAKDLAELKELRSTLRERMQQSPLMDSKRFARHMEEAYRQMWRKWCGQ
jgi:predicted O-linked N-acetylglucosamine transferase (SPINDLY family)